ncbi:hypothetical protein HAP99_11735 [Acidithiobacillus caldus]|uniref:hypothetical protein n=1 Tax=Acidithiobacillus caldus TaxID=33059 RepID=UPI001C06A09D|nr:hypothetical protein [Acidithiobacillus caldus]MBU2783833.1 hypothetical protein [Acidithiobacillus caldus]
MKIDIVFEDELPLSEASRLVRRMASTIGWDVEWKGDNTFQLRRGPAEDEQDGFGRVAPITDGLRASG